VAIFFSILLKKKRPLLKEAKDAIVLHSTPSSRLCRDAIVSQIVVSFYHLGVIVSTFDHNLRVAGNGEQIADGTVPIRRDIPSDGVTLSYHVVFTLRAMISTPFIHPCRA
jgi:hypothetical protein